MTRRGGFLARSRRGLRIALRVFLVLLVIDMIYVATIWPDWNKIAQGAVPKSSFMEIYEAQRAEHGWGPLVWHPVPLSRIPRHMIRAVIVAEDSRFYTHSGFDLEAIKEALDYNLDRGKVVFGASTITQQTVKNLFLSPSRNPLRKWHEVLLTWGIEHHLRKSRIMELYLNIAEFGRGLYGVQAAAQHYYHVDVEQLDLTQAAELAATLPSPVKRNPETRPEVFERRVQRILGLLNREQSRLPAPAVQPLPVSEPAASPDTAAPPAGVADTAAGESRL